MGEPAVFEISAFVSDFLWPCLTIGAILPAGAAALAALYRAVLSAVGFGNYD